MPMMPKSPLSTLLCLFILTVAACTPPSQTELSQPLGSGIAPPPVPGGSVPAEASAAQMPAMPLDESARQTSVAATVVAVVTQTRVPADATATAQATVTSTVTSTVTATITATVPVSGTPPIAGTATVTGTPTRGGTIPPTGTTTSPTRSATSTRATTATRAATPTQRATTRATATRRATSTATRAVTRTATRTPTRRATSAPSDTPGTPEATNTPVPQAVIVRSETLREEGSGVALVGEVVNGQPFPVYGVTIIATFFDSSGNTVAAGQEMAYLLETLPTQRNPFKITVPNVGNVTDYELTLQWDDVSIIEFRDITVPSEEVNEEETAIVGELRNDHESELTSIAVVATFYDEEGNVVDMSGSFLGGDILGSEQTMEYTLEIPAGLEYDHFDVQAQGNLNLF